MSEITEQEGQGDAITLGELPSDNVTGEPIVGGPGQNYSYPETPGNSGQKTVPYNLGITSVFDARPFNSVDLILDTDAVNFQDNGVLGMYTYTVPAGHILIIRKIEWGVSFLDRRISGLGNYYDTNYGAEWKIFINGIGMDQFFYPIFFATNQTEDVYFMADENQVIMLQGPTGINSAGPGGGPIITPTAPAFRAIIKGNLLNKRGYPLNVESGSEK